VLAGRVGQIAARRLAVLVPAVAAEAPGREAPDRLGAVPDLDRPVELRLLEHGVVPERADVELDVLRVERPEVGVVEVVDGGAVVRARGGHALERTVAPSAASMPGRPRALGTAAEELTAEWVG